MFHFKLRMALIYIVVVLLLISTETTQAGLIFRDAKRSISGSGTQVSERLETAIGDGVFVDDLLVSGYYRDENQTITGSVSATASLSSNLTEGKISGLGRGSGFGSGPAEGVGEAKMKVDFSLNEATQYSLSGQLRLVPHSDEMLLNGSEAMIRVTGADGVVVEFLLNESNPPDRLGIVDFTGADRRTGFIPAGDYTLEAISIGHGSDGLTRCTDFEFTFSVLTAVAVPEPSSLVLFTIALSAFGLRPSRGRGRVRR